MSHVSHPLLLSHLPFTTSTSSSSFTLPSSTTPEHAPQLGQHDLLQEHPVHHKPPEDLPVDRQRHQESLWRENLQSGRNPRTTFSTCSAGAAVAAAATAVSCSVSGFASASARDVAHRRSATMSDATLFSGTSWANAENGHVSMTSPKTRKQVCRILWKTSETRSNQWFLPKLLKNYQKQKPRRNRMPEQYLLGPMTWKVTRRNVWKDIANLRIKRLNNDIKSPRHDHQLIEEENVSVGEMSTVCSQIVLGCLYLALIGRHEILWSVNKLARAVTKWTKSRDKTLGAFDLVHSSCKWIPAFLFCGKHSTTMQTWIVSRLWFCRRPWRLKMNIRWTLMHFRKSNICANKLDVQETEFSFTQSYRSWSNFSWCRSTHGWNSRSWSLGSGYWMKCCILHPTNLRNPKTMCRESCCMTHHQGNEPRTKSRLQLSTTTLNSKSIMFHQTWIVLNLVRCFTFLKIMKRWSSWSRDLENVDFTSSNVDSSRKEALLYIFEDNEAAVIKMIIKGRSPTLRHVSWTHRVALDCLFDRINLDPKIQIKYVDTNTNSQTYSQRAISHVMSGTIFSICSISAPSAQQAAPKRCWKRMQQGTGEERIVAKSKPTLNLVPRSEAITPTAPSSSASSRPGILRAPSQQGSNLTATSAGKPAAGCLNQNDAAPSSQMWLTDAKLRESARKPAAEHQRRGRLLRINLRSGAIISDNWEVDQKNRRWSQDCPRLIEMSLCGENHLCCVIDLFESWNPKTASFLTGCYVWEASVHNLFKPGKTKLNGIWKHAISKTRIELTVSRWNSWKIFPGFTSLQILTEIKKMMTGIMSEPERLLKELSSCQCTTTLYGENEETQKNGEFPKSWQNMQEDCARTLVVSWAWITEKVVTEWKVGSSRWGQDAQLQCKRTHRIPCIQCFGTRRFEKQRKGKLSIHFCGDDKTVEVVLRTIISVNQHSIYGAVTDMCDELACRISDCSKSTWNYCDSYRLDDHEQIISDRWECARKLAAKLRAKHRKSSISSSVDLTMLQCWYQGDRGEGTVLHDPRRCGTGKLGGSCREYAFPRSDP